MELRLLQTIRHRITDLIGLFSIKKKVDSKVQDFYDGKIDYDELNEYLRFLQKEE